MAAIWLVNDVWQTAVWRVVVTILPVGNIAGSLGIIMGILFQRGIPAFLIGLIFSFVSWLVGSAFGLAAGFSNTYEFVSRSSSLS